MHWIRREHEESGRKMIKFGFGSRLIEIDTVSNKIMQSISEIDMCKSSNNNNNNNNNKRKKQNKQIARAWNKKNE